MRDELNPYETPEEAEIVEEAPATKPLSSGQAAYNTVTDTVTGANLRWKDNLMQLACIVSCMFLGAAIGAVVAAPDYVPGAIAGALVGMLVGLFGSGIFLMIYRGLRHLRGKHD